jgi:hypothetical protein
MYFRVKNILKNNRNHSQYLNNIWDDHNNFFKILILYKHMKLFKIIKKY